jgi:F-type H+-transporting ATPase subunit b
MEIAGIFLLPNGTFFVELAILLIILFVTTKFILPPLTKAMEERQEDIRSSLEAAENARADAAAADDERRGILEASRSESREIVAAAQAETDAARADAQARGQAEAERIIDAARLEVDAARRTAIDEAVPQLGTIVMGVVERVIGRQVDMGKHQDLIDSAVGNLKNAEATA